MGLDGISINQLRIDTTLNSAESNKINQQNNPQFIDGLSKGQRIDADEKKEGHEKNNSKENLDEENEENEELNTTQDISEELKKYDLSDTKKYILKVDDNTNQILIIEKTTQKTIQAFSPELLSNLAKFLANSKGTFINRKY